MGICSSPNQNKNNTASKKYPTTQTQKTKNLKNQKQQIDTSFIKKYKIYFI